MKDSTEKIPEMRKQAQIWSHQNQSSSQGEFDSLSFNHGGQKMNGKRVIFKLDVSQLEAYIGLYYSPELRTTYELKIENGTLIAKHTRQDKTVLTPLNNSEFSGNTWFFGSLNFQYEKEKIAGFKVSTDRAKNVLFKKINGDIIY